MAAKRAFDGKGKADWALQYDWCGYLAYCGYSNKESSPPANLPASLQDLLAHAFDDLGAIRVEFKTDERNLRSQAALERIGATREGVLRRHMIVQEGYLRNSVYFSILDEEWSAVRRGLEDRLVAHAPMA